jgi:5-methylcytosine-specific restriction enzyme A
MTINNFRISSQNTKISLSLEKQICCKPDKLLTIDMVFNPGLEKNQVIDNNKLCSIFKCSPQGGMRRSHRTNTLVIISNHTKEIYPDRWINGVFHYVGMGLTGNQDINHAQNLTLCRSQTNGIKLYLFEVFTIGKYTYRGEAKLVDKPYQKPVPDIEGNNRIAWIFQLRVI